MARYELTEAAEADLAAIADYTIETFGIAQARRYRDGLTRAFENIAQNPRMGREAGQLRSGYRRFEHRSHAIFYQIEDRGIRIVRVLHMSMDPERHI